MGPGTTNFAPKPPLRAAAHVRRRRRRSEIAALTGMHPGRRAHYTPSAERSQPSTSSACSPGGKTG